MKKHLLLLGIPAVALSACLIITNRNLTDLEIQIQKNRSVIMELTDTITEKTGTAEKEAATNPLTDEEKELTANAASDLGDKVAGYQNIYYGITSTDNPDEFKANVEALSGCFTESSQSARVPWYYGEIPGTWTFINDGKFKGTDNKAVWVCRADDGSLLAYAAGFYDKEEGKFKNITHKLTVHGLGSVASDEGEPTTEIDVDKVNDIAEDIKAADPSTEGSTGWSGGDMNDVRGGQEALREYYLNGGGSRGE